MQANAKLLHRTNRFSVKTKHDKKRLDAASVSGHRVLVTLQEERFYDIVKGVEREHVYPAGTGLMFNGEQELYHVFVGGMYQMLRSKSHASRGEREDSKIMRGMTQLTFDFISRLRTWTYIGDEGKDFTDDSLRSLANQLDRPKRNERKLTAAQRFRKAADLKTQANEKRMPMPSAFTAAAGAQQLDLRRADVQEILRWIDDERLSVFALVEGVHMRLDDAWRIFSPQAFGQPGHPVVLASRKPTSQSIKVMRDRLRPIYRGLREIKVRPLNGLADDTSVTFATLRDRIMDASSPVDIMEEVTRIRQSLTVMRVVRGLEMDVITPLSILLHRWKRLEDRKHDLARARTHESCLGFEADWRQDLDFLLPQAAERVRSLVGSAALQVGIPTIDDKRYQLIEAKKTLKRLSSTLT